MDVERAAAVVAAAGREPGTEHQVDGTDYRTRSYGLSSGSEYKAYRPKNIA